MDYVVLCVAAALGGVVNSVAGGGTLLTFPALVAALHGVPGAEVSANITSSIALFPGSVASMWGYRRELGASRRWALLLIGPSLLGGLIGALLLTRLSPESFKQAIPWLLLLAAVLFAMQPQISRWTGIGKPHAAPSRGTAAWVFFFQLLVGIYGGYFGAGIGILMLSSLALMGLSDIHQMNALKTLLASCINGVAVAVFVFHPAANWSYAGAMAVAAIAGGYGGAAVARRTNRTLVRTVVVLIGFSLAGYYFWQQLMPGEEPAPPTNITEPGP